MGRITRVEIKEAPDDNDDDDDETVDAEEKGDGVGGDAEEVGSSRRRRVYERIRLERVQIAESVRVGDGVDCSRDYWFDGLRDGVGLVYGPLSEEGDGR